MASLPTNLTNYLLIAPPNMPDKRFAESVVYIARHDERGAFGFIINKVMTANMLEIFQDIEIHYATEHRKTHQAHMVLNGGPVMPEVGFILHTGLPNWHSSVSVTENVCFTSSKDILEAIAQNNSIAHYHMCLGHASWQAKQLENELADGGWFVAQADIELLFNVPIVERWHEAGLKAGVNFDWLIDTVGQA